MGTIATGAVLIVAAAGCATAAEPRTMGAPDAAQPPDSNHEIPDSMPDAPSGSCAMPFTGVLATWSFAGATGSQTSTPVASTAPGVTATDVMRSAGLTAVSGANSINSSNWATTAQADPTKYYTLSITPPASCALDLTMIAVDARSSSTGPANASVATSSDTYAAKQPVSTTAACTPALSVTGDTAAVQVRIYGYAASGTAGTLRLQTTLTLTGSLH